MCDLKNTPLFIKISEIKRGGWSGFVGGRKVGQMNESKTAEQKVKRRKLSDGGKATQG